MAARRPLSELGAREDWISPFHARRAAEHGPRAEDDPRAENDRFPQHDLDAERGPREEYGPYDEHAPRDCSDSTCYPPDSDCYRTLGEGRVADEGTVPAARVSGLPGAELDRPWPIEDRDSLIRVRRTDQVNVRLTTPQFQALARAGELYGLSPTEMARLFINRGSRAVLTGR